MKASQLVIGALYHFNGPLGDIEMKYEGVIPEDDMFPGEHFFSPVNTGYPGAVCTDEEVANRISEFKELH